MKMKMMNPNGIHHSSQHQQDGVEGTNGTHIIFQDDISLVSLLKACAIKKDLYKGSRLHAD
eukprot:c24697_g2_i2 orf=1-180(-)